MQFVDAPKVHQLLDYSYLIEFLYQAHLGQHPEIKHIVQQEPDNGENQFVTLVGWKRGAAITVKMVGVFPGNLSLDPPQASVQGLVALFDSKTGGPLLVADGEAMTSRKTAADSGLGTRMLAREDVATLLVVGAGGLAPHVIWAHCTARPSISQVTIWNRTPERAQVLAERIELSNVTIAATCDLDKAVSSADIISCVTMSDKPLVKGALMKPGSHLDLVGAYRPSMREADNQALIRGTVFVDTYDGMDSAGDLVQPVVAGIIDWNTIVADYYALAQGRHPGRMSEDEITICKNVGGGHLDLFAAQALFNKL
jgi:ornithine cyclodeaminase